MSDKFDKYLNVESELEKDSRFKMQFKDKDDSENMEIQRQNIRIYIFYAIIVFFMILIFKAITDDLNLINSIGLNFFNMCNFKSY